MEFFKEVFVPVMIIGIAAGYFVAPWLLALITALAVAVGIWLWRDVKKSDASGDSAIAVMATLGAAGIALVAAWVTELCVHWDAFVALLGR